MDNQPKLPTPEQWEHVQGILEEAAVDYWIQELDDFWDYMLDDTRLQLAAIVRTYFPEMNERCKQHAKERMAEMEDSCRPPEEEQ